MDKFSYLGVTISTDRGIGDEVAHSVFVGSMVWEVGGKIAKREHDVQRKKTRVTCKSSGTNRGIWF